uniref:Uncharacterized protein n=1 Tax=Arundo donax TaxID=35708 RepID=A0A0A8YIX6_ARUDO
MLYEIQRCQQIVGAYRSIRFSITYQLKTVVPDSENRAEKARLQARRGKSGRSWHWSAEEKTRGGWCERKRLGF